MSIHFAVVSNIGKCVYVHNVKLTLYPARNKVKKYFRLFWE